MIPHLRNIYKYIYIYIYISLAQTLPDMHKQFQVALSIPSVMTWTYFVNIFTKATIHFPPQGLTTFVSISIKGVSIHQFSSI